MSAPELPLLHSRAIARSPVPYGWVVLGASTVGMAMTLPGRTTGLSVFLDPMLHELGLSRAAGAWIFLAGTLIASASVPFFGRALDRRGPRAAVTAVAALFAAGCWALGHVEGPVSLFFAFWATRGLGFGALWLGSLYTVNQWFVRRRGLALGIAGLGVAVSNALVPPLLQGLVARHGWRDTLAYVAAAVFVVMVPVGAAFFREKPERYGLMPDGAATDAAEPDDAHASQDHTLGEALRTPIFWLYATGGFALAALETALVFHHFSLMGANGVGRAAASAMFVSYGLLNGAANLGAGLALDRFGPRALLVGSLSAMTGAIALAPWSHSPATVLAYGALIGLSMGTTGTLMASCWAHYFGRAHLGAINGVAQMIYVAGCAIGPLPFAMVFDHTHAYGGALAGSAIVTLALIALASLAREPRPIA